MKTRLSLVVLSCALALVTFLRAETAFAGNDPLKVAPEMYKLLYENDRVRVMEVSFQPGQKIAEHSHPDHFVTVLEPGTLTISKPDGTSNAVQLATKQVVWIPAESHWAENTGKTPVKLLVTELKGEAATTTASTH